ncbi:MAG: FIST C-terminal domain-containing protein [Elusimicrobia bacterium]|nr:FIST C-terminal domain-containing protein [Elusimicrobiota bacterium]
MKIVQAQWNKTSGWNPALDGLGLDSAHVAFIFAGGDSFSDSGRLAELRKAFPAAQLFGCSTAGEICGTRVLDDSIVVTAVRFDHTTLQAKSIGVRSAGESFGAGQKLAEGLPKEGLVHMLVLSDGLQVNGSELVKGLTSRLPKGVTVTGGLSGDGARFQKTMVLGGGAPEQGMVAALGLYGSRLRVGYASLGGWDPFGPERIITRSKGNVLYELDGRSALDLYKQYLGDHAAGLPATGLLYPLSLRGKDETGGVVRTILSVDEKERSMTFAGDMPEGSLARLMKANFDRLIDGAVGAAKKSREGDGSSSPDLALLISCVGRKMVLKQRVEEEVEGVREVLGGGTALTGFYSYGEISPFTHGTNCELHNQTMTITTFCEQ